MTGEWPYLATEVLQARQAMAAHFLRGPKWIVEVGGGETPIGGAIAFDPRLEPPIVLLEGRSFGLALLGLDLRDMTPAAWDRLIDVAEGAWRVVIEHAADWIPAVQQRDRIVGAAKLGLVWQITLDASRNPMPPGPYPPRLHRFFGVYER